MKIVVLSDTHGYLNKNVKELLQNSDCAIHAGDVGSLAVYQELKALNKNLYPVRGNCDRGAWADVLPETLAFRIDGVMFYLVHDRNDFSARPEPGTDLFICGHTHIYQQSERRGMTLLNPGSCSQPRGGLPPTCAIIETQGGKYTIHQETV